MREVISEGDRHEGRDEPAHKLTDARGRAREPSRERDRTAIYREERKGQGDEAERRQGCRIDAEARALRQSNACVFVRILQGPGLPGRAFELCNVSAVSDPCWRAEGRLALDLRSWELFSFVLISWIHTMDFQRPLRSSKAAAGFAPRHVPAADLRQFLVAAYCAVRAETERRAAPLSAEDQNVQSMPDASPAKWHRAHTTWFFEQFLLREHLAGYQPFDERFAFLFNSYYVSAGPRPALPEFDKNRIQG